MDINSENQPKDKVNCSSKKCTITSIILMSTSLLLTLLAISEIYYPDKVFSFVEALISKFPDIWEYTYHIASIEIFLAYTLTLISFKFNKKLSSQLLETFSRIGLGLMFILASVYKISNPQEFAMVIAQYQFLPQFAINLFALILPMTEMFVGLAIIFTKFTKENALLIGLMFVAFILALAHALYNDLGIVCGCFSFEEAASKSEAWVSLIRDILLMPPTIFLMLASNKSLCKLWKKQKKTSSK